MVFKQSAHVQPSAFSPNRFSSTFSLYINHITNINIVFQSSKEIFSFKIEIETKMNFCLVFLVLLASLIQVNARVVAHTEMDPCDEHENCYLWCVLAVQRFDRNRCAILNKRMRCFCYEDSEYKPGYINSLHIF